MARHSKRHHYVPRFVLREFRNARGHLHLLDRTREQLYHGTPNNVFFEKHLYRTFNPATDAHSDDVEKRLSVIESNAAPVVQKIIRSARSGMHPNLSAAERYAWAHFYHAQSRRTRENLASCLKGDDALGARAEALGISLHEIDREIIRSALPMFASGMSPGLGVEEYCHNVGLMTATARRPRNGLVIGSAGMPLGSSEPDRFFRGWLPLTPDVAVRATVWPNKEIMVLIPRHASVLVNKINLTSARHSRVIAARRESDLRAVIKRLGDASVPMT